ncbi:hypothetical protein GCM10020256_57150 [Streptomyces thermocoprophilus]
MSANRFGIPALAHEECLAGFAAWGATAYPVPLSWGATFDPELIRRMAAAIGEDMRRVGIHQGLAPVLDVVRDARWGRVEETIGEDPYLVGTIGTAYVQGLESAGIVATLKHFAGYSASRAGRNLAPVSMGSRERADVLLPPFEMALREGGARSVMHAYTDTDGIPSAADEELLTGLLRDTWGFTGTVVADYFGIAFLKILHGVAGDFTEAAALALRAGVDVELPSVKTFGADLVQAVTDGTVPEELVDRALRRVLAQKAELGLLDADFDPVPPALKDADTDDGADTDALRGTVDLDSPGNRELAARAADESVILLRNNGALPLSAPRRIALIGPQADEPTAVLGCYSFPLHVGVHHPEVPVGIALPTLREALVREFPGVEIVTVRGADVDTDDTSGFDEAVRVARDADVVVVALGDRAGLFGRGTSGEGCDAESLALPGVQQALLDRLLDTGTPLVVTLLAGRPTRWAAPPPGPTRSWRPSSPAPRAPPPSPACSAAPSTPPAGCRSACPPGPGASPPPISPPGSPAAATSPRSTRPRRSPSGTVCRTRRSTGAISSSPPRRPPPTGSSPSPSPSATPATGTAPRSSSSICTTRSPPSSSPCSGSSATAGCRSPRARHAGSR